MLKYVDLPMDVCNTKLHCLVAWQHSTFWTVQDQAAICLLKGKHKQIFCMFFWSHLLSLESQWFGCMWGKLTLLVPSDLRGWPAEAPLQINRFKYQLGQGFLTFKISSPTHMFIVILGSQIVLVGKQLEFFPMIIEKGSRSSQTAKTHSLYCRKSVFEIFKRPYWWSKKWCRIKVKTKVQ